MLMIKSNKFQILDLLYGENLEKSSLNKSPNLSERHENGTRVKINLLKELWNEEMKDLETGCNLKIIIPDDVQNEMEERLILCEDVEKTLIKAQENKERFVNTENSHYLTRMRIGNVTY